MSEYKTEDLLYVQFADLDIKDFPAVCFMQNWPGWSGKTGTWKPNDPEKEEQVKKLEKAYFEGERIIHPIAYEIEKKYNVQFLTEFRRLKNRIADQMMKELGEIELD